MKSRAPFLLICFHLILFHGCANQWDSIDEEVNTSLKVEAVTFTGTFDLEYQARLYRPDAGDSNGWGVLMIGGGYGNDLDWTTPGKIEIEGKVAQVTITGENHHDAPVIAGELQRHGFTVLHYSTISIDDPFADQWPTKATVRELPDLTNDAISAFKCLRTKGVIDPGKIILLGHSLGATRACTIAAREKDVQALILLAPAYFANDSTLLGKNALSNGAELLATRSINCLAIFGQLDNSPAVDYQAALEFKKRFGVEIKLFENCGHNLSPEHKKRIGPIHQPIVEFIADWASQLASQSNNGNVP